ncbi:MAG: AMP-binding protein, partial [Porticoccus sp.]
SGSSVLQRFKRKSIRQGWLEKIEEYEPQNPALPADLSLNCFISFTSGTTGSAKGVQLTYRNLLTHLQTLTDVFNYSVGSRILNNMMLAHADGLIQGPMLALYNGCALYRPCSMDVQHLETFLNTVYRERITHMLTVPTILSFMDRLASHDDYFHGGDFGHLISVAGTLDTGLWQRLEQRFSVRISNIYGLTETVAGGVFCGPDDDRFCHGTVGKPVDMALRVVDVNGKEVGSGEQGELWLKGENVFAGYFNDSERTAEVFTDEWFHTGDLAFLDDKGFVHICGRSKELIITGGFNVHPSEVNEALLRHPEVAEVATLGMSDPDWQEIVVSAVVMKEGKSVDDKALIVHCRQWLEPKKVPRKIMFVTSLPRGDAGKVKLPELKDKLLARTIGGNDGVVLLGEGTLLDLAADVFQIDKNQLSLQSKAGDTPGWDSLGHLMLVMSIEKKLDKTLTPQQIMAVESLSDVLGLVNE